MRPADSWRDYELLDATNHNRLERWGQTLLIRPDPQVIWKNDETSPLWAKADAVYYRSAKGGGQWNYHKKLPQKWQIHWNDLTLIVSPTGFKHTGVFPEQAVNWAWYQEKIRQAGRPIRVLNLFGYTGGATLACLAAGASVTHVDASKGMVAWARENAAASELADRPAAGSWTTAPSLCSVRSAAAAAMTLSSWTRRAMAAARAARSGSSRTTSTTSSR